MEVQNDECLEEKEPATEMEVSPAEKINNLRERAGYIRRRNTSIIALICILCLMFSWLTLVIYPQRKLNIWKMDGVSGTKEIMLENIPAPDDVCIVNGSNEEELFISWNKALWEVKGPDEIKLILRYEEVEALKSGVVDVFRMTDGSWGFLTRAEELQTSEYKKRDYYALIRVSAK